MRTMSARATPNFFCRAEINRRSVTDSLIPVTVATAFMYRIVLHPVIPVKNSICRVMCNLRNTSVYSLHAAGIHNSASSSIRDSLYSLAAISNCSQVFPRRGAIRRLTTK